MNKDLEHRIDSFSKIFIQGMLIPLKNFPASITKYPREYVKITRPEDIEEYDYLASLTPDSEIDFSRFRSVSSDLNWEGIYYLLPIAQRRYLQFIDESIIDFFDGFIRLLGYLNGIDKLKRLMSQDDILRLIYWLRFLLEDENPDINFIDFDEDEINRYIDYLEKGLPLDEKNKYIQ
ncbi:hypothetical protein RO21_09270 [[Actinobacillus] muris]|uniref:Uncharacterized protein n=1 Tax=Muribacter muris TaxID=67855 RepID=A0A0J5P3Q5_9PAST|nr:hypothetical protein [Muribacter muris]KMK50906.1 hypothetical protein RO21_09270 [[Actinobacillus] muris] [Muribacter muris]